MSAKTKRIERGQRFRRLRRGANRARAVSPVVATLILILIAVAAAAALYLWLVVWQGHLTGGIGNPGAQSEITIGGSTSVYPFSSAAVSWFEQNNTDVVISDVQGGTGAGMDAVCAGNIDVGAASFLVTPDILETTYGCPVTPGLTITTIAFDAVDVVVAGSNPHGLLSTSWDTLNLVYERASTSAPSALLYLADSSAGINNQPLPTGYPGATATTIVKGTNYDVPLSWEQIPAAVQASIPVKLNTGTTVYLNESLLAGGVNSTGTGVTTLGVLGTTFGGTGTATVLSSDEDCPAADWAVGTNGFTSYYQCTGVETPCGWSICAGGASSGTVSLPGAQIVPVSRSDASGTTQTFESKILGYGVGTSSSATTWATTFSELAYSGCGGNNLLSDCGFTYASGQEGNGNPAVIGLVAAESGNAIGYASDGLARATGSGVAIVPFLGSGQSAQATGAGIVDLATLTDGGVLPTTGASGTIAQGVIGGGGSNIGTLSTTADQYVGWRPFDFVTLQPPAGEVERLIQFITEPSVNTALASYTAEVGIYQV